MFRKAKEIFKTPEIDEEKKGIELERSDYIAMAIALSYYMFPVLIGIFAILGLITWILFF